MVTAKVKQLVSDIGEEFREDLLQTCGVLSVCGCVCEWLVVGHHWVAPRQPTQGCLQVGWPLHCGSLLQVCVCGGYAVGHQWVEPRMCVVGCLVAG